MTQFTSQVLLRTIVSRCLKLEGYAVVQANITIYNAHVCVQYACVVLGTVVEQFSLMVHAVD